jgi:hypothetical protein
LNVEEILGCEGQRGDNSLNVCAKWQSPPPKRHLPCSAKAEQTDALQRWPCMLSRPMKLAC